MMYIVSFASSFTKLIVSRVPHVPAPSTTLIRYADDNSPTTLSQTPPSYATHGAPKPKKNTIVEKKLAEITHYQTLGVSSTATREEIKRRFNLLAKRYHPDARKHQPKLLFVETRPSAQTLPEDELDFGMITSAWKVLSDEKARRKYDRELLYKQWAEDASKLATKTMEEAAPMMAKMMDDVAVPFLQKTALSTVSLAKATADRVEKSVHVAKQGYKKTKEILSESGGPLASISAIEVLSKISVPLRTERQGKSEIFTSQSAPSSETMMSPAKSTAPDLSTKVDDTSPNQDPPKGVDAIVFPLLTLLLEMIFFI